MTNVLCVLLQYCTECASAHSNRYQLEKILIKRLGIHRLKEELSDARDRTEHLRQFSMIFQDTVRRVEVLVF